MRDRPAIRAFRTFWRAYSRLYEVQKRFVAERTGLTLSEFDMLAGLGNTEGLRMGELATAMVTSPANVTRVAVAMEKKGLVGRRRAEHSDREVVAFLTPEGMAKFEDCFMDVAEHTTGVFEGLMSDDELATLATLCARFVELEA